MTSERPEVTARSDNNTGRIFFMESSTRLLLLAHTSWVSFKLLSDQSVGDTRRQNQYFSPVNLLTLCDGRVTRLQQLTWLSGVNDTSARHAKSSLHSSHPRRLAPAQTSSKSPRHFRFTRTCLTQFAQSGRFILHGYPRGTFDSTVNLC